MLRASNFSLLKSSLQGCDKALSKFSINNIQARQDARADSSYSHTILFCYRLRHSALPHKLLVKNFSDKFIVSYEICDKRYSCRCQRTAKSGIEKSHKDIGEYSCSLSPIPPPIIQAIIIYALRSKKCQNGRRSSYPSILLVCLPLILRNIIPKATNTTTDSRYINHCLSITR